jgi:predicted DNA-binding transcriptional regulator AlpA
MRRILRANQVFGREGLAGPSKAQGWRLERAGRFPQRVQISDQAVGWYSDEVARWISERVRGIPAAPANIVTAK